MPPSADQPLSTTKAKQYQGASPTGQYGGAICIERSLKTNQWNTFSFPMRLTGEQIRYAFGEDAKLAYIHSVGKMSQHENVIDFKSVTLRTTDPVVLPGHFYLLKPTKLPAKNYDPLGREREYYELGRKYFSVKANEAADYTHFKLPTTKLMEGGGSLSVAHPDRHLLLLYQDAECAGNDLGTCASGCYNGSHDSGLSTDSLSFYPFGACYPSAGITFL